MEVCLKCYKSFPIAHLSDHIQMCDFDDDDPIDPETFSPKNTDTLESEEKHTNRGTSSPVIIADSPEVININFLH